MHTFWSDTVYALRTLTRNVAFATAAVLTLALGVGANTAIFSVVNGILLRPLPYPDAENLYVVWNNNTREGIERDITSYPNFQDWRENDVFAAMAAFTGGNASLTGDGEPEQLRIAQVTPAFVDVLGVAPALGRNFAPDELQPGPATVVLLSDALWRTRFGGDRSIVGRSVMLNGTPRTVVGVMPQDFAYPADATMWLPLVPTGNNADSRGSLWLSVIGRVRNGVTPEAAQARMDAIATQLAEEYPGPNTGAGIMLEPLQTTIVGDVRTPLLVLLGAVAVVLLIGCANVANLLLARGAVRRKELAVRIAMGAGRARMARQLLTESVVLGLMGGIAGTALSIWAVSAIVSMAPPELPRLDSIRVDTTVLLFGLAVSIATGLLFGLAPLLQSRRADVMSTLRDGGRDAVGGEGVGRLRPILLSSEVGLALVLLVAAGLLIRSFAALNAVDPGFEPDNAVSFRVVLPGARYDTPERVRAFHTQLQQEVRAVAGVESVGGANTIFLSRLPNMTSITREGDPPATNDAQRESVVIEPVTPGFFDAMGIQLVRGRDVTASDVADGTQVAVVNEAFVARYYPAVDPIGRRYTYGNPQDTDTQWIEIVGVVRDARRSGLALPSRPESYLPHGQATTAGLTYVVRSANPTALITAVRDLLRRMDPLLPISAITTLDDAIAEQLAARRFIMTLLVAFAAASQHCSRRSGSTAWCHTWWRNARASWVCASRSVRRAAICSGSSSDSRCATCCPACCSVSWPRSH